MPKNMTALYYIMQTGFKKLFWKFTSMSQMNQHPVYVKWTGMTEFWII
jgi:hypothetical protein